MPFRSAEISAYVIHFASRPCLLVTVRDVTCRNQRKQERENLIAELENKNSELERFTYAVSHDLKSPLLTIRGYTEPSLAGMDTSTSKAS